MATAAKTKSKTTSKEAPLEIVYEELVELMMRHAPPFRTDIACMSGGEEIVSIDGAEGGGDSRCVWGKAGGSADGRSDSAEGFCGILFDVRLQE